MRAILRTGNKTIEQIVRYSIEDPQQMEIGEDEAKIVKSYLDAFDGCRVFLSDDGPHHFLEGWDGDFYNVAKIKEALYLMNQIPMLGLYIDDREGFERDWAEGEFACDAGISFKEDEFEPDTETPKEKYERLRREYPGARVINEISGKDMEGVTTVKLTNCHIKEYVYQDGHLLFKDMARDYVDALTYHCTQEEMKQARNDAWEVVNGLKWQIGIFLELKTEG